MKHILKAWLFLYLIALCSCSFKNFSSTDASNLERALSKAKLQTSDIYMGRSPLSHTFEFSFSNSQNHVIQLRFTNHDTSLSGSNLYLKTNTLPTDDFQKINDENYLMQALNSKLPSSKTINWAQYAQSATKSREGYELMRTFIRIKLRES